MREVICEKIKFFLKMWNRGKNISPKAMLIHKEHAIEIMKDPAALLDDVLLAAAVERVIAIAEGVLQYSDEHECIVCQEFFLAENYRKLHKIALPAGFNEHKALIRCDRDCRHNPDPYRRPVGVLATTEMDILGSHYRTESGASW